MGFAAWTGFAVIPFVALLTGCVTANPAGRHNDRSAAGGERCATAEVAIDFNFAGASPARCVIEGMRSFSLLISPEHGPPINPSPWYAFRYKASSGGAVTVRLTYLGADHRYAPKLTREDVVTSLPVTVAADRHSATVALPSGSGIVSAQPVIDVAHYNDLAERLTGEFGGKTIELGRSLDGRAINAMRFGDESAPRLIIILGRQHPPEVTGSYALEPFLLETVRALDRDPAFRARYQILAVPLLNPDGVERGHWRANRGGIDLNRDWGTFTQPETRAVRDWLTDQAAQTRPAVMIDFHSTGRNLFYVQGDEENAANRRFLESWLVGKEDIFPGYPFTIQKRNANPGSGTAKNWFFECFSIPAYTYEVSDDAKRSAVAGAARKLATDFVVSLPELARDKVDTPRVGTASCLSYQSLKRNPLSEPSASQGPFPLIVNAR